VAKYLPTLLIIMLLLILLPWERVHPLAQGGQDQFTGNFPLLDCEFLPTGTNAFFNINPGQRRRFSNIACFESGACDTLEEVVIQVLSQTRTIPFQIDGRGLSVNTRVIQTQRTVDGTPMETSSAFYAECQGTRDVYQFGKTVQTFNGDGTASTAGTWLAGVDDALPGLAFPGGAFLLGSKYFKGIAPAVAVDRAEHVASGLDVTLPFGTFANCIEVRETTGLNPALVSTKTYCPGVGLVQEDEMKLIEATGGIEADSTQTFPGATSTRFPRNSWRQ
jgi:hypothetical protein